MVYKSVYLIYQTIENANEETIHFLRNGLKNFSDQFIKAYKHKLDKWNGSIKTFEKASEFIKNSFPFLEV